MATLSAWKFSTPDGADQAVATLKSLASQELIKVHNAATESWPEGKNLLRAVPRDGGRRRRGRTDGDDERRGHR